MKIHTILASFLKYLEFMLTVYAAIRNCKVDGKNNFTQTGYLRDTGKLFPKLMIYKTSLCILFGQLIG